MSEYIEPVDADILKKIGINVVGLVVLSFLLIGGHDVASHGYGRTTIDVDLLVRKSDRGKWLDLADRLGFRLFHDGDSFLQFSASNEVRWPLGLILVNDEI